MQKFAALMISSYLTALASPAAAKSASKEPFQRDKLLHVCVSAVATAGGIKTLQAFHATQKITTEKRIFVSTAVMFAGLAWELDDQRRSGKPFDQADFAADIIGIVVGNFLQWEF